jgi:hypothetical protein
MSSLEIPYNIGNKLGELVQHAEICTEFAKNPSNQRPKMKILCVYESLRYILQELELLVISETLLQELRDYLDKISGGKLSDESTPKQATEDEMLLTRIKKSIKSRGQNLDREMKTDDIKNLSLKLKIWRDRISNEFTRI